MKKQNPQQERDPLEDAFTFLKSVPDLYPKTKRAEAYAIHADELETIAKDAESRRGPEGWAAFDRLTRSAEQTRQRARLCSLVADGQSIQAAIATVLGASPFGHTKETRNTSVIPKTKTTRKRKSTTATQTV